ncbi:hypothetical protein D3C86_350710 [compost metagenome]
MKVAIITSVAQKSSKALAEALKNNGVHADVFDMNECARQNFVEYNSVFSFGSSAGTNHSHRFNKSLAVKQCVSKPRTFDLLKEAGCFTVPYVLRKQDIPKEWECIVVREDAGGRKAEGMHLIDRGQPIPHGQLFTEYFFHNVEYRIMVFNGAVVARYEKVEGQHEGEVWHFFENRPKRGFEAMDEHCLRAAKALGIDYVGFDVVAKTKKDFRILEANSAARLEDEAENAIVEYYINL